MRVYERTRTKRKENEGTRKEQVVEICFHQQTRHERHVKPQPKRSPAKPREREGGEEKKAHRGERDKGKGSWESSTSGGMVRTSIWAADR